MRFDNRDVGLSSKIEGPPVGNLRWAVLRAMLGLKVNAPYTLDAMAADAIGLLDRLGIARAHIVGASMGGMIAQIIAWSYPARTRSLVSIMSTSGARHLPQATREAHKVLFAPRPPASAREQVIAQGMAVYRVIGSPGYPVPDAVLRPRIEAAVTRSYYPAGVGRQMLAILADGSRVDRLRRIAVPTLVIHGAADPLVPVEGGQHTAAAIPGAKTRDHRGHGA